MSTNIENISSRMGRRPIEIDLAHAKELVASHSVTQVAELLGIHRNTFYYHLKRDTRFKEAIEAVRPPKKRSAADSQKMWIDFYAQPEGGWCKSCARYMPLTKFAKKTASKYRHTCKACTHRRWNELQTEKRQVRDEQRKVQLSHAFTIWMEGAWRVSRRPRRVKPQSEGIVEVSHISPERLYKIIDKAMPLVALPSLREDIRNEMIVLLLTGEIDLALLRGEILKRVRQFHKRYQTAFFSLDVPLKDKRGEEFSSLADLIT